MLRSTTASVLKFPGMAQGRCRTPRTDGGGSGGWRVVAGRDPDRVEGTLALPVEDQLRHLPVPELEGVRGLHGDLLDVDSTAPAATLIPQEDEDPPVVELMKRLGNRPEIHPGIEHRAPEVDHPAMPLRSLGCGAVGELEVDLGIRPIRGREIPLRPAGKD